nr:2-succinyl-6-hydroxy-2,4-cyclohexadiene-1-carboxylate synthase [Actinomycetota bacterium]
ALVVISATPGLDDTARRTRRDADEALARRLESEGLAAFLDAWSRHPLVGTAEIDPVAAAVDRERREENSATGLAAALRGLGQGALPAVDLDRIGAPMLWIAGARDGAYAAAAQAEAAAGHGRVAIIAGAGHNVVLEAPRAVRDSMDAFLTSLP